MWACPSFHCAWFGDTCQNIKSLRYQPIHCIDDSKVVLHTSDWDFVQEKSNGKNAKFPAARIVDGVVKSIIVEKVIHTKFMAYRDQRFISQVL